MRHGPRYGADTVCAAMQLRVVADRWCTGFLAGPLSYQAMAATGDYVYVFGGCKPVGRSNDLFCYHVKDQVWSALSVGAVANSPSERGGPALVALPDAVHVLFGYNGKVEADDHFVFDLVTKVWRQVQTPIVPPARSVTDAVYVSRIGRLGSIFVFGGEFTPSQQGHEGAGEYHGDAWLFDIDTERWTQISTPSYVGDRGIASVSVATIDQSNFACWWGTGGK